MAEETGNITRIIACGVFKPALDYLKLEDRYPNLRITYLRSNLHLIPQQLQKFLMEEIAIAQERKERVICLYGDCFPDIDKFCQHFGVTKVPGHYCHEMLLGSEQFCQILDETTGTYFTESDLVSNFQEYCLNPLELDDEEMRQYYFNHYRKLLHVRQPSDPDLENEVSQLAEFLNLSCEIMDADYSHLEKLLVALLDQGP